MQKYYMLFLRKRSYALLDTFYDRVFVYDGIDFRPMIVESLYINLDSNIEIKTFLKELIYIYLKSPPYNKKLTVEYLFYDTATKRRTGYSNYFGDLEMFLNNKGISTMTFKPHHDFGSNFADPCAYLEFEDYTEVNILKRKMDSIPKLNHGIAKIAKRFFLISVINYLAWKRTFQVTNAKAIILNAFEGIYITSAILAAKKLNRKVFVFNQSIFFAAQEMSAPIKLSCAEDIDCIFTFGYKEAEIMKDKGYETKNFFPIGSVRHKKEYESCRDSQIVRKRLGISDDSKVLLFIAFPGMPFFKDVLEELSRYCKANQFVLIVKIHPDAKIPLWLKFKSFDPSMKIIRNWNVLELINVSDVSIGYASTSLFESVWLGKPAIWLSQMDPLQLKKLFERYFSGYGILQCDDLHNLSKCLKSVHFGFDKQRNKLLKKVFMDPTKSYDKAYLILRKQ